MVFSSLLFLYAFLPLCLIFVHFSRSIKAQNIVLLVFSLLFYAWGEPLLILLMLGTATFAYLMGHIMEQPGRTAFERKLCVGITVVVMISSLATFKYLGFIVTQINLLPGVNLRVPQIGLPIGISFYTFQILTYVLDLYRGDAPLQKSWYKFVLYVSLFPQLIAGPIVRYRDVALQIDDRRITGSGIVAGINRFLIGLAKKVLIANQMGMVVSQVMDAKYLPTITGLEAWLGLIGFALQIYFDFSGYSDMAIGLGRMFGFEFKENFRYPYTATSITDFWRRWHISLSTFFRDYVYIPLGGNRQHQYRNMLIVWGLTGFWHGASWNFLLWGLYFFVFLTLEKRYWMKYMDTWAAWMKHAYTLVIVLFSWVLFYYTNLAEAGVFLLRLFGIGNGFWNAGARALFMNNLLMYIIAIVAMTPVVSRLRTLLAKYKLRLPSYEVREDPTDGHSILVTAHMRLSPALVALMVIWHTLLLFLTTASLAGSSFNPFLYFRF